MSIFNEENKREMEALQARMLLAQLDAAIASDSRYTDRQMAGSAVRMAFTPEVKEVLRQVSFTCGQPMAAFCVEAVINRVQQVLGQRITAVEVDDAE